MRIGDAAQASGVSAKMIRHYEAIGLVPDAARRPNSYRDYDAADVHRLRFIRRARDLGFPMVLIRDLLRLWSDEGRSNAAVRAIARRHIAALEGKIADLREMSDTLSDLARACEAGRRADCPILADLQAGGRDPTRAG